MQSAAFSGTDDLELSGTRRGEARRAVSVACALLGGGLLGVSYIFRRLIPGQPLVAEFAADCVRR